MDHVFNDTPSAYDLLANENRSLVKYNSKQSDALRRILKEVRDHRYRNNDTPGPDYEQNDADLYETVEAIAGEFGGLYGTV